MSYPTLVEHGDCLEIRSRMLVGMRVLLAALSLFPLAAPYELLIKIEWKSFLNPYFFVAAGISAGAMALSVFLVFAAVAGMSSKIVFDRRTATLSYSTEAPVVRRTSQVLPLSDVVRTEIGVRDEDEGAPTYRVRITVKDGTVFESGPSWSRDEVDRIRRRVDQFLATVDA
jgi:hypothetical protein